MFAEYLLLKENAELFFSLLKTSNFIIKWNVDWLLKIITVYILFTLLSSVRYWLR
jgi:hypothetical protein